MKLSTIKICIFDFIILTGFILISCTSHEQKEEDAFTRLQDQKATNKVSVPIKDAVVQKPAKSESVIKTENPDEWTKFKYEIQNGISSNEKKIKAIKKIPDANSKLLKRLAVLEKENTDLKRKMDEFNEEMKMKLEQFKVKMNHEINGIEIELKDI